MSDSRINRLIVSVFGREPVVDYARFRPGLINEPEYSHIKLLSGWIVYFIFYFLTENLIPEDRCHVIHCALDDMIPFDERFLILYCFWFLLIVFSLLYFFLFDIKSFRRVQVYIIITQVLAMTVYIIYPSIQIGRPEVMPRDNILCRLMSLIYAFDTPTGVCPSLHVAYSLGIASTWCKARNVSLRWKISVVIFAVLICISVVFVKQHSVIDIAAAIPVALTAEYMVFRRVHEARVRIIRRKVKHSVFKGGRP